MATIFLNLTNRQKPQQIETVHTGKLKFLGYLPSEILLKQLVTSVLVIIVMLNMYRLVTSTEVTKLVIDRGAVVPEVNNQLSYRVLFSFVFF